MQPSDMAFIPNFKNIDPDAAQSRSRERTDGQTEIRTQMINRILSSEEIVL
jgi:hypothetical protein